MSSTLNVVDKENLLEKGEKKQIHAKTYIYVRSFQQISGVLKVVIS